jgi:hypothetical protein
MAPISNGSDDDHDERGRFVKGNRGGPGAPEPQRAFELRQRFLAAVRDADVERAVKVLRSILRNGKDADRLRAVKELLDRTIGTPIAQDVEQRLADLESQLGVSREH